MKYLTAVLGSCLLLASFQASAGEARHSLEDWSTFMTGYYKHPEPGRISEIIAGMAQTERPVQQNAVVPAVMFFSYVFAANPSMRARWTKQIGSLGGQTQQLMLAAIHSSPESLLAAIPASPARNDALWSCFFATGKSQCLEELISDLAYVRERFSEGRFDIGSTAKWPLASNMASNPPVREAVVDAARNGSPQVRAQAASILKISVTEIRAEGTEVIQAQRAAGLW